MRPLLVGELNPYGADPYYALFCLPPGSAGGRMQRLVCRLHQTTYLKLDRVNLCEGRWRDELAAAHATRILSSAEDRAIFLLGRKVADAFGFRGRLFTSSLIGDGRRGVLAYLPHPSGRCRVWNDPESFISARHVLASLCPEIPWGELSAAS